jgi:ubiquinone/menaquinone biosynthesis C-methylase UbiE
MIGVDISPVAVAGATERAEKLGLGGSATFHVASLEQTGLDEGVADAVVSIDALQYAPNKLAALREAARLLRPGGRIALTAFSSIPSALHRYPSTGQTQRPTCVPCWSRQDSRSRTTKRPAGGSSA